MPPTRAVITVTKENPRGTETSLGQNRSEKVTETCGRGKAAFVAFFMRLGQGESSSKMDSFSMLMPISGS